MNISAVSAFSDSLALMATNLQSEKIPQEIGTAVLKGILSTQKQQAEALIAMINSTSSTTADGTGRIVNVGA